MTMKSVLMISPYFVPRRRVGALRTFKFAIHLKESGYRPVILTIKDNSAYATPSERQLLKNLNVIELNTPVDRTVQSRSSAQRPSGFDGLQGKLTDWVDRHTPSDTWIYFYLLHYVKVMKSVRAIAPDLVWATGDPWSSLVLGRFIAKKLSVPFVCDFRDPWTRSGISLRERSAFSIYWDQHLEKKVLLDAAEVVFTSQSAEQDYLSHFSHLRGKTSVIYNAANNPAIQDTIATGTDVKGLSNDELNIVFFGTFRRLSPITPVADMVAELKRESSDLYGRVKVHSFGIPEAEQVEYAKSLEIEDSFIFHDKVKPENGPAVLDQFDLLLLSTHPDRSNIVPAKLWDYLNTDVPILSVTPNAEVGEIIKKFEAGEHYHPLEVKSAAKKIAEWAERIAVKGKVFFRRKKLTEEQIKSIGAKKKAEELSALFDKITEHE